MPTPTLTQILQLDGAANLLAAAALALLAPALADPAGLTAAWPLWLLAAGLAAYGLENAMISRRPDRAAVTALITIDGLFALAVLALVLANPTGAEVWVRWVLFAAAELALIAGAFKAHRLWRPSHEPTVQRHQPA